MEEKIDSPFKNFGMMIPNDVERHPDGTQLLFVSQEDKEAFIKFCYENIIPAHQMSVKEREELFKKWKQRLALYI